MKSEKELRKEIDKLLGDKVSAAIKVFQAQRDESFTKLMTLYQALEPIEGKKAGFLKEQSELNILKNKDLGRFNYLDGHIRWFDGQIKGYKGQIEKLIQKLTEVEIDPKTLTFILNFKS